MPKKEPFIEYHGPPDDDFRKHIVEKYSGIAHIRIESNEDALYIAVTENDPE